jgi:hypothetical protein
VGARIGDLTAAVRGEFGEARIGGGGGGGSAFAAAPCWLDDAK